MSKLLNTLTLALSLTLLALALSLTLLTLALALSLTLTLSRSKLLNTLPEKGYDKRELSREEVGALFRGYHP